MTLNVPTATKTLIGDNEYNGRGNEKKAMVVIIDDSSGVSTAEIAGPRGQEEGFSTLWDAPPFYSIFVLVCDNTSSNIVHDPGESADESRGEHTTLILENFPKRKHQGG